MRAIVACMFGLMGVLQAASGHADSYPSRTIKLIVPYSPGGPADLAARLIAQRISASLHQTMIVENKPGGNNLPADVEELTAPKDGYTLLLETPGLVTNTLLRKNLPYKLSNFVPISEIVVQTYALLVPTALPAKVKDYIAYAKARPGQLNYAASGVGSTTQLMALKFLNMTGLQMIGIQYPGQAPSEQAIMTNDVQLLVDTPLTAIPIHEGGKARILGITSAQRLATSPDIPTLTEEGVPFVAEAWYAIMAAAGTPQPILDQLNREIAKAVNSDEYRSRVLATGAVPRSTTLEESARLVTDTIDLLKPVIEQSGIHLDTP